MSTYGSMYGRPNPWRDPDDETEDYPKFWVHDGRQAGSITIGQSRLPVWAVIGELVRNGWDGVVEDYEANRYMEREEFSWFLYDLFELRGEFGRLLCVLADVERNERLRGGRMSGPAWWQTKKHRKRVTAQLQRCLVALEEGPE